MTRTARSHADVQPSQNLTLVQLVQRAALESVDVVAFSGERAQTARSGRLSPPEQAEVTLETSAVLPKSLEVKGLACVCTMSATWQVGGQIVARLSFDFRLSYSFVALDVAPPRGLAEAFVEQVALHHAWPFARERMRSASVELGLLPFVLPLRALPPLVEPSGDPE